MNVFSGVGKKDIKTLSAATVKTLLATDLMAAAKRSELDIREFPKRLPKGYSIDGERSGTQSVDLQQEAKDLIDSVDVVARKHHLENAAAYYTTAFDMITAGGDIKVVDMPVQLNDFAVTKADITEALVQKISDDATKSKVPDAKHKVPVRQ